MKAVVCQEVYLAPHRSHQQALAVKKSVSPSAAKPARSEPTRFPARYRQPALRQAQRLHWPITQPRGSHRRLRSIPIALWSAAPYHILDWSHPGLERYRGQDWCQVPCRRWTTARGRGRRRWQRSRRRRPEKRLHPPATNVHTTLPGLTSATNRVPVWRPSVTHSSSP